LESIRERVWAVVLAAIDSISKTVVNLGIRDLDGFFFIVDHLSITSPERTRTDYVIEVPARVWIRLLDIP